MNSVAAPPLPGAIFTTLVDGTRVNANHYQAKEDVYLDGGPGPNAPSNAAGLPEGDYYFQVTDPSGKDLLSTDHISCRKFHVNEYGVIDSYYTNGINYVWVKAKGGGYWDTAPCVHDTGVDIDHSDVGAITVQLYPYDDTPNPGGVYKVWATPVADYAGDPNYAPTAKKDKVNGENYEPGNYHGFIPAKSKTDNYKVKKKGKPVTPPDISIFKFEDLNGNGLWETNEPALSGWPIYVTDPLDIMNTYWTDSNGGIYILAQDGTYTIEEDNPGDWSVTATLIDGQPITPVTGSVEITVDSSASTSYQVAFGNFKHCGAIGHKYNDLNGDGTHDSNEPGVPGWTIYIYRHDGTNWILYDTVQTDANGYYYFEISIGGSFKVVEDDVSGWVITGEPYFIFNGISGTDVGPYNFLNFEKFEVDGHKYEDMNGDGNWDTGDTGLAGWTVTLYKKDNGAWVKYAETTTDSTGYYKFEVDEGGGYMVEETQQSGWVATSATAVTFNAESGKDWSIDFLNFKLGKVSGNKWYDFNKNGVKDGTETFTDGITIELWKDGSFYQSTVTANGGYYEFDNLGPGDYVIKEILPSGGTNYVWAQTYPDGNWEFSPLTSGTLLSYLDFGNVKEYPNGLTWGYWKTHTGYDSPARDSAYDLLAANPMSVDVTTPDSDKLVESDYEAKWVFDGAGTGQSPDASGDGRSLFRAQLLALHMNLLKETDIGGMYYVYDGDIHREMTVNQISSKAISWLTDGQSHYFHPLLETIDRINNNGNYDPGDNVLVYP
jgi:hypothetical protein